jgi:hypothetical protein
MTGQWRRFWALALRDSLVLAATLALWQPVLRLDPPAGLWPQALHVLAGLLAVLCGFLLHEWGHLAGAWLARAALVLPASPLESPFLFRFNNLRNSRGQFCAMSLGGFASSLLFVAFLLLVPPRGLLASHVAQALTAIGVLATLVSEVPGLVRVMRGAPLPGGPAYVSDPVTMAERARIS